MKNLDAIRSDGNVLPQPVINLTHFNFDDGDVAVVEVLPSDLPPVRYKGRVWIRVGPRKGIANEQEERIRLNGASHWRDPLMLVPVLKAPSVT